MADYTFVNPHWIWIGLAIIQALPAYAADWPFSPLPDVADRVQISQSGGHPIDELVGEQLGKAGLRLSDEATPRELVRRAWFDLIGLPPDYEAVRAFESDPTDDHWERIIDELLSRPQYGERWASHWLDIVRFAETNGYERDGPKPEAWRYRDYVVRSLNEDKSYARFIREQIAGDQLFPESTEALIATGFYRLHVYDDEPDNSLQADYDALDDILSTIGSAFIGMTLSCARCHDHKFDDITQKDYYSMLAFIHGIEPYGKPHSGGGSRPIGKITRPLAPATELHQWHSSRNRKINNLTRQIQDLESAGIGNQESRQELEKLKNERAGLESSQPPYPGVLAISEKPENAKATTHLLYRGDPSMPRESVPAAFPPLLTSVFSGGRSAEPTRSALADWIADTGNPLTARVMMNRLWLHHFGRGLVETPNDFGESGSGTSHQKLLDHLASVFIQSGWSLKEMHRYIMTSRVYRQSSRMLQPAADEADPANKMWWRQEMRRLDAEAIRDSMLSFSGDLNLKTGGPGVFPALPAEVHTTQDSQGKGWGDSPTDEQNRRSIYVYAKRALPLPFLESFDGGPFAFSMGRRPVTTVAPQALTLLNGEFMQIRARNLAARARSIENVYKILWQRLPEKNEMIGIVGILESQTQVLAKTGHPDPTSQAFIYFCLSALNASETIMID